MHSVMLPAFSSTPSIPILSLDATSTPESPVPSFPSSELGGLGTKPQGEEEDPILRNYHHYCLALGLDPLPPGSRSWLEVRGQGTVSF
jgi:hypothetical protein